jgi:hypothetical protein
MEFSDIVIIFLLLIAIIVWLINLNKKCPVVIQPEPRIIYRFKPELDLQFDSTNFPTAVYTDLFNGPNTYMGGYKLDSGRSTLVSVNDQNNSGGTINPVPINN